MSLKVRVTFLVMAILVVVAATVSAVAYHELRESYSDSIDVMLRSIAQTLRADLDKSTLDGRHADVRYFLADERVWPAVRLRIWNERTGKVLLAGKTARRVVDEWASGLGERTTPEIDKETFLDFRDGDRPFRALWFRYRTKDGTLSVLIAASSLHVYREMREFLRLLLILAGSTLLAAIILTVLSVFWAMRPIRTTAERLGRVTYRNIGIEQLSGLHPPEELAPFVEAVRAMLVRLDEAMRAQRRFIANASHELRTPLALAKSTLQAVRLRKRPVEEYTRALDDVLKDINRLERLASQLLDLERLGENDASTDRRSDVPLGKLLAETVRGYASRAAELGGSVICDTGEQEIVVRADADELKRLFSNLLDNALKYGPAGGTVKLSLSPEGDRFCTVTVHDDGGSISANQIEKLFERFYRVESSRNRSGGGAGLGLSIAKEIVRKYAGDIRITSAPGKGTDICVRLPRVPQSAWNRENHE